MTRDEEPKGAADDEFTRAGAQPDRSLVHELIQFMAENKVWWMAPILIIFGLLGILLILGATGIGPFIYVLA